MTSPGTLTDRELIDHCERYLSQRQPTPLALLRELLTRFETTTALIERAMDNRRENLLSLRSQPPP